MVCQWGITGSGCDQFTASRGLCAQHYRQQFIAPYDKEIANTETLLANLRDARAALSRELNAALRGNRETLEAIDLRNGQAGRHAREQFSVKDAQLLDRQKKWQRGDIEALKYIYCDRCHKPFDQQIELIEHQENCNLVVLGKRDQAPTKKPKKSAVPNGRVAKPKPVVEAFVEKEHL